LTWHKQVRYLSLWKQILTCVHIHILFKSYGSIPFKRKQSFFQKYRSLIALVLQRSGSWRSNLPRHGFSSPLFSSVQFNSVQSTNISVTDRLRMLKDSQTHSCITYARDSCIYVQLCCHCAPLPLYCCTLHLLGSQYSADKPALTSSCNHATLATRISRLPRSSITHDAYNRVVCSATRLAFVEMVSS
jgi:hypothetical protein